MGLGGERWAEVERLFHEALVLPPGERGAYLASSSDDREIIREVTELLAADSGPDPRESLAAEMALGWAASQGTPLIGREVDGYRFDAELGAGGMGEVFRAHELALGRDVALKLLPLGYAVDQGRLRRFAEEARAASALNHPNIITVLRVGEFDGRRYIATELIEGKTLRDCMSGGPFKVAAALDVAIQVAAALAAAHAAGIVHRDIKPENLMVRSDGYVKVLDFGLAKLTADEQLAEGRGTSATSTRVGAVLGTVNYMSPEQSSGGAVEARSDLYSLSVVLHEMLTGHLPGSGSPDVPGAIAPIVARGLARDPNDRYPSADAIKADLERVRREILDAPVVQRRRRMAAMAAATALVLIGLPAIFWSRIFPPPRTIGSVAVLPMIGGAGLEKDQNHLTVGLADAIAMQLREVERLRVTPSTTVRHFVNTARDPVDVGKELGVESVLSGSVARSGDTLDVTLRLVDVVDGKILWTGSYTEPFTNIFAVRNAITTRVASTLVPDVGRLAAHPRRETSNSEAYELYLRGREQWARRSPASIRSAIELFERSAVADPTFAPAFAGAADSYALTASGLAPQDRFPKAKAAALKALDLDESLADAHNALGFISYKWEWQWDLADREFNRALQLQPDNVLAWHWYSEFLSIIGRHEAALAGFAKARELDPYSTAIVVDQAAAFVRAGRGQDAVTSLQSALKTEPNSAALTNGLYQALLSIGRDQEAFDAQIRTRELAGAGEPAIASMRAAFESGGFPAMARADLVHLLKAEQTGTAPPAYFSRQSLAAAIARWYVAAGDRDNALHWLEESTRRRDDGPLTIKQWYWRPYADDPRFQALARQIGMP
jgi:TolB-like protein/Tfp pilus assembly protein PilF